VGDCSQKVIFQKMFLSEIHLQSKCRLLLKGEVRRLEEKLSETSALHQTVEGTSDFVAVARISKKVEIHLQRRSVTKGRQFSMGLETEPLDLFEVKENLL
jgi:hypothetical protein